MYINPQSHRYPSLRNVVYARNGMACSSQPLVTSIGVQTLAKGGNAMDAAIAMAGAIALVEPTSNGLGGDAFALIWWNGKLYGLNASGTAPKKLTAEAVKARGYKEMPMAGWTTPLVPGMPKACAMVQRRFCTMTLEELWKPAIRAAKFGYPIQPNTEKLWADDFERICAVAEKEGKEPYRGWYETFTKDGKPYKAGDLFKWEAMAETLLELAETDCDSLYEGRLADEICRFSDETGGFFQKSDFEEYSAKWVDPISTNYKGYDICEIPPNGHGITVLMALNILKGMDLDKDRENPEVYHKMIEALKLAFIDAKTYVADPRYMKTRVEDMLSESYAEKRRALIGKEAIMPFPGNPSGSDTVYFCTADAQGNMVSWIQSNYRQFGSGIVIPGTGIALQNRASNFSLDPASDNFLEGGKRSYHTIIPGFMCKDGKAVGPFGVMGGFMQPQGHLMVVTNTVDFGMNPQEALDAPRFQWTGGKHVQLETEVPAAVAAELKSRGHEIEILADRTYMGRGQIIWRTDNGMLCGGTESRADGSIGVL